MRADFFRGMKVQSDEVGGRILVGDNTSGGVVILLSIRVECVGAWISFVLTCIHIYS
jgi:hypothetical protein